mgnify:CR=1 FL=1
MAELHIDTDWKKQAQEEKRRLAEAEAREKQQKAAQAAAATPPGVTGGAAAAVGAPGVAPEGGRQLPPASFATLVQSIVTQVLFYLGDLATRGGEPMLNLDLAKHHVDMLGVIEEKTRGNLTEEEKRLLDAALYEVRMRYVSVASQFIS